MKNEAYGKIQRAIGMIDGVAAMLDGKASDALDRAAELLEEALESAWGACPSLNKTAVGGELPAVQRQKEWDASRYLPVESGWYQGYIEGAGYSDSVYYKAETQVWTNVAGGKVNVERWCE